MSSVFGGKSKEKNIPEGYANIRAYRRVSYRPPGEYMLLRLLLEEKLSAKLTDEVSGIFDISGTPHPALRATFPSRGRLCVRPRKKDALPCAVRPFRISSMCGKAYNQNSPRTASKSNLPMGLVELPWITSSSPRVPSRWLVISPTAVLMVRS